MQHDEHELPAPSAGPLQTLHVLFHVQAERAHDVILIDLSDTDDRVEINTLDAGLDCSREQAIASLMNILRQLWIEAWSPEGIDRLMRLSEGSTAPGLDVLSSRGEGD